MPELGVDGPYEIAYETNRHGTKHIYANHGREFFEKKNAAHLRSRRGCYLFAIRNRGHRAVYVGKAAHGFDREVFTPDKLNKYNGALHEWPHGTPVLLFVTTPTNIWSESLIIEVERHLIRLAKRAWPDLLNVHHAGADNWDITGVTAPHRGRRSVAESTLVKLLKFKT
jgi:hypothetical protein